MPNETLVHIAGPAYDFPDRSIQRCAVCGAILIDTKNQAAPLNLDGSVPRAPFWRDGALVSVTIGNPTHSVAMDPVRNADGSCRIPENFCLQTLDCLP